MPAKVWLLPTFEFGYRGEPEFFASTVRPARMVPQLVGLFAGRLFIIVRVLFRSQNAVAALLRRDCLAPSGDVSLKALSS